MMLFKVVRPNMNITFSTDNYPNTINFEMVELFNIGLDKFNPSMYNMVFTSRYIPEVQDEKHMINKKSDYVNQQNQFIKVRHI